MCLSLPHVTVLLHCQGSGSMPADKYREIVRRHLPRGARLTETEKMPKGIGGEVSECKHIKCFPIECRWSLMLFLHECGHLRLQHFKTDHGAPRWREEYEANKYAIDAMRSEGLPLSRPCVTEFKSNIAQFIHLAVDQGEHIDDEDVLRFAE